MRAKSEILSRASHELRTPMNHILGFAQLLEMDVLTDDQAASVHEIIHSGEHLLSLINRILKVTNVGDAAPDDLSFLEATPASEALFAMSGRC